MTFPYPGDDPSLLLAVAANIDQAQSELGNLSTQLCSSTKSLAAAWTGDAATAAQGDLGLLTDALPDMAKRLSDASAAVVNYYVIAVSVRAEVDTIRSEFSKLNGVLEGEQADFSRAARFGQANDMNAGDIASYRKSIATNERSIQTKLADLEHDYERQVRRNNTAADVCNSALRKTFTVTERDGPHVSSMSLTDGFGLGDLQVAHMVRMEELATKYADELKNHNKLDGSWATLAHQIAGKIGKYSDDPDFAATFYGELGPQRAQDLPTLFTDSGSQTVVQDLPIFTKMFSIAVSNSSQDSRMGAIMKLFTTSSGNGRPSSWDRGVMCSNGSFPATFLAQAARANALDDLARGTNYDDYRGHIGAMPSWAYQLGVQNDEVGLWMHDLAPNADATRAALATMGSSSPLVDAPSDPVAAYASNIHKLMMYSGAPQDSDVSVAIGAALENASGADDEVDGSHSAAAFDFAKGVFTDFGQNSDDSGAVQAPAAGSYAKIAASYVQELAAGSPTQYSGEGVGPARTGSDGIPGDIPAFAVSSPFAQSFMKTFVGDPSATATFDTAAGLAAHHAMLAGALSDKSGLAAGTTPRDFRIANEAYGALAGTENRAQVDVVGKQVEDEEHAKELMQHVLTFGVDMLPLGGLADEGGHGLIDAGESLFGHTAGDVATYTGEHLVNASDSWWDLTKNRTDARIESAYDAPSGTEQQLDQLKDAHNQAAMASDYGRLSILKEAGWPGTDRIPAPLLGADGNLKSSAAIFGNGQLSQTFYNYMAGSDSHNYTGPGSGGEGNSVFDMTRTGSDGFVGGYNTVDTH